MKSLGDILGDLPPELQEKAQKALENGGTLEEVVASLVPAVTKREGEKGFDVTDQAVLAERLQFDEDAPELRTGPLPPEVLPALPVKTTSRDSTSLGWLLEAASKNLHERLQMELLIAKPKGTSLVPREPEDPPNYRRGQVPAPVEQRLPPGFGLAPLDEGRRRELTWKFISTTQGRRSLVPVIEEGVAERLRRKLGVSVEIGKWEKQETAKVKYSWSVSISGPKSINPAFALVDTAIGALSCGLARQISENASESLLLRVRTLDFYEARKVGWLAGLWSDHTSTR